MSQARLFNAVEQLRQTREDRRKSMMQHMASLDGYGQIGFAIGTGLARLFSQDERAREEQVAQGKNDYLAAYMQATPEERAFLFAENGLRNFPDYAIEVKDMVDKDEAAAAEAARTERLMQIKEQELRIKQAEAGQFDTEPLTPDSKQFEGYKTRLKNMIKLMPEDHPIAQKIAKMNDSGEWYDFFSGLEDPDYIAIIDNAELLRRQNKASNMTIDDALKLSLSNYVSGGQVAVDAQSESQARTQRHIEMFNKAAD